MFTAKCLSFIKEQNIVFYLRHMSLSHFTFINYHRNKQTRKNRRKEINLKDFLYPIQKIISYISN